jgi:hypothetical protein
LSAILDPSLLGDPDTWIINSVNDDGEPTSVTATLRPDCEADTATWVAQGGTDCQPGQVNGNQVTFGSLTNAGGRTAGISYIAVVVCCFK